MKYSVVSIQPQIWDNDAIWVWRSLAFPPSQKPPIPHRHFSTAVIQESSVAGFYLWEGLLLCWLSSSSSAQKTVNVSFPTLHFFLLLRLLFLLLAGSVADSLADIDQTVLFVPTSSSSFPLPIPPPPPPPPRSSFSSLPHSWFLLPFLLLSPPSQYDLHW